MFGIFPFLASSTFQISLLFHSIFFHSVLFRSFPPSLPFPSFPFPCLALFLFPSLEVVDDFDLIFTRVCLLLQRETLEYKVVDQEYVKGLQEKYVNYLSNKCTFYAFSLSWSFIGLKGFGRLLLLFLFQGGKNVAGENNVMETSLCHEMEQVITVLLLVFVHCCQKGLPKVVNKPVLSIFHVNRSATSLKTIQMFALGFCRL